MIGVVSAGKVALSKVKDRRGTADSHSTKYRPDLDGLRAVAVLSVIAFHISGGILPGGYLGVDIFFVLSGYLITGIIWREALNGNFSIVRFYERRIRRIMPALLALLVVVSGCSIALLLPSDLKSFSNSVLACLTFVANIYFWRGSGYFARASIEKPLLHMWSLGVEEQFYIIFPLLILLCIRFRRSALLTITSALLLLSLWVNIRAIIGIHSQAAFFLLPFRGWELGAGAVLALLPDVKIAHRWLRQVLGCLSIALLIGGLFFNSGAIGAFVPPALWVVAGTVLAILVGNAGGSGLTFALSLPPLVFVGLISYSLYLWHWPILVFMRYYCAVDALSRSQEAIALVLVFGLAALSWRYVERPFRDRKMPIRTVLTWAVCGMLVVATGSVAVLVRGGLPNRFSAEAARIDAANGTTFRCGLDETVAFGNATACLMSLPRRNLQDATLALLGNSQAQMYAPLVADILRQNGRGGILVAPEGCLPMPEISQSPSCMIAARRNLAAIEKLPHVKIVVLSMTWPGYADPSSMSSFQNTHDSPTFTTSLDDLIQYLEQQGKSVVLIGPIAPPGWDAPSIVARQIAFGKKIAEPLYLSQNDFTAKEGALISHFSSRRDIFFIRPDLVQCNLARCDYIRGGASLFADASHIARGALPLFRPVFEPVLDDALKSAAASVN